MSYQKLDNFINITTVEPQLTGVMVGMGHTDK